MTLGTAFSVILRYLDTSAKSQSVQSEENGPDKDDILLMVYLLHDGYEKNQPISTMELAQFLAGYAPLELELKLIKLEETGLISHP